MTGLAKVEARELLRREVRLEELAEVFISSQDVKKSSRATYSRQLRQFISWLTDTGRQGQGLSREDILAYRDYLSESKTSLTVAGYLTAVRKFFEYLEAEKIYPNIAKVKSPKKPKGFRKDCLSKAQLREALQSVDTSSLEGLRDYALFNLLARTALRTVEVARAEIEDIRQESGQPVLWIQGKGRDSKDDFVILNEKALAPLKDYLEARAAELGRALRDNEPLFASLSSKNYGGALTTRSISRIVKKTLRKAGLDSSRMTAHSLRHTAITLSIAGGASLQQAQAMARHSDTKTTLIYWHNLERVRAGAENFIDF
jgi:integrase/recombinase XerC/integrase/recombinase XerD